MSDRAPSRCSILCVDDNELLAEALRRRIELEPDLEWAGVVTRGQDAFEQVMIARPHVVLMDIDMPDVDTFAVVEQIRSELPQVRVLMFSGHVNHSLVERAIDSGAWGYLSKNDEVSGLIDAIRVAAGGNLAFSREVEVFRHRSRPVH